MKMKFGWKIALLSAGMLLWVACGQAPETPIESTIPPPPPTEVPPTEPMITGSVVEGGRLYDRWWTEAEVDEPAGDQPLWATQSTNTRSGTTTWRCKECHGWDYMGADGAYGSGSHFTGFPGVLDASADHTLAELLAALDGSTDPEHDFSAMGEQSLANLVTFLKEGTVDVSPFIDAETKAAIGGDALNGANLYAANCTACHGEDGRQLNFGDEEEPEYVGTIAADNPWEFIHKVRMGQPGTNMPAGLDLGWTMQDVIDVMAFAQTLPQEAAASATLSRGGRLYDAWWREAGAAEPTDDNPIWARQETNTREGSTTWRCKECHGWDYLGAEGAYGSGSHFTGFPGILAAKDKSVDEILAQLTGQVDPEHDFSVIGEEDLAALATFIREGLLDVSVYIDSETRAAVGGDASNGESLYTATCTGCHGVDGREINFGDEDEPEYVGTIALDNPWEFIHKVRMGQPGTNMPAALDLGWSIDDVIDLLSYSQSLPTEAP